MTGQIGFLWTCNVNTRDSRQRVRRRVLNTEMAMWCDPKILGRVLAAEILCDAFPRCENTSDAMPQCRPLRLRYWSIDTTIFEMLVPYHMPFRQWASVWDNAYSNKVGWDSLLCNIISMNSGEYDNYVAFLVLEFAVDFTMLGFTPMAVDSVAFGCGTRIVLLMPSSCMPRPTEAVGISTDRQDRLSDIDK